MARRHLPFVISTVVLGLGAVFGLRPASALAAQPEACPPDEWFCDESEPPSAPPEPEPGSTEVPPEPATAPPPSREWTSDEPSDSAISLRTPKPAPKDESEDGLRGPSPWGVNLRLEGVLMSGRSRARDAGMGGVGVSLRYVVNPVLTLDVGLDSILGTDYQGYGRGELTLSFSTLLFFNRHPSVRSYALLGLNSSAASVERGSVDRTYGYFGAHGGIGLDIPLQRDLSFDLDLIGFIRGRTDGRAAREPEFTDGFGRVSNTGGGALFRAGVSLFW